MQNVEHNTGGYAVGRATGALLDVQDANRAHGTKPRELLLVALADGYGEQHRLPKLVSTGLDMRDDSSQPRGRFST